MSALLKDVLPDESEPLIRTYEVALCNREGMRG